MTIKVHVWSKEDLSYYGILTFKSKSRFTIYKVLNFWRYKFKSAQNVKGKKNGPRS